MLPCPSWPESVMSASRMKNPEILDLIYDYPESLVATSPQRPPRVAWIDGTAPAQEISLQALLEKIPAGDVLVVNDTRVLKRRVFAEGLEILFLNQLENPLEWEVLFPSRDLKVGAEVTLPLGRKFTLLAKGRPQKIQTNEILDESFFDEVAELPLPPYIQKARGERHNVQEDVSWYQTAWAEKPGSLAAPTASLHFSENDIAVLKKRGVQVETLTLHVGLGTFLPLTDVAFEKGVLHKEPVSISSKTWENLKKAKTEGRKIWALGTTVTRSLESAALGMGLSFETDLFIRPGFQFKMVDVLMTNFHQPGSSLLSLVMAFAEAEKVKQTYAWAIQKEFKLFSYGDFSVWKK